MNDALRAFVARMKLGELQGYRSRLHAAYDDIEADAAAACAQAAGDGAGERARLRVLYDRLRNLEIAGKRLHPDLANLDVVLLAPGVHTASGTSSTPDHLVASWIRRLETSIAKGRARADAATLFGGLAGEALDVGRSRHKPDVAADANATCHTLRQPSAAVDMEAVTAQLSGMGPNRWTRLRKTVAKRAEEALEPDEVSIALEQALQVLIGDASLSPSLRTWLRKLAAYDDKLPNGYPLERIELGSALRLSWADIDDWDYQAPVRLETRWTRNRWRAFPVLDTMDRLLVELLTLALESAVVPILGAARLNRVQRLQRLIDLDAPPIIVENERQQVDDTFDLDRLTEPFYWRQPSQTAAPLPDEAPADDDDLRAFEKRSQAILAQFEALSPLVRHRMVVTSEVTRPGLDGDYGDYNTSGLGIAAAFNAVHAELTVVRALDAGRDDAEPVAVLKTDLKDFFPSMPHDLVTGLLTWIGVPSRLVTLAGRMLAMPLADDDGNVQPATRGVPLGLGFGRLLARVVITALVGSVRGSAHVRVLHLVDDLVIMGRVGEVQKAWAEVQRFCAAAGLAVNADKTGAVCLNLQSAQASDAVDGLPDGPVRWGMLELTSAGHWRVSDEAVDTFLSCTIARIEAHSSLLDRVRVYREQLLYLLTWLAPSARLGDDHLQCVAAAAARFANMELSVGADETEDAAASVSGFAAMLRGELSRRFLSGDPLGFPDAWLHWPLTAGGLALPHIGCALAPLDGARASLEAERPEPWPLERPAPDDAETGNEAWTAAFRFLAEAVVPAEPVVVASQQALLDGFMARGGQVLGRKQRTLAPVWRWVIATFGPDILEHFGSYDFLDRELVPTQLLRG